MTDGKLVADAFARRSPSVTVQRYFDRAKAVQQKVEWESAAGGRMDDTGFHINRSAAVDHFRGFVPATQFPP
jgi:hypothetical protein